MFSKSYDNIMKKGGDSKIKSDSHNKYSVISVPYLHHLTNQVRQIRLTRILQKLEIVAELLFLPAMVGLAILFLVFTTAIWG